MKSTSIHSLNADRGLSKLQKIAYLFLNWVNNLRPFNNLDQRIVFKPFERGDWRKLWGKTFAASSAARKASDLFWAAVPWEEIAEYLGGGIHIFDTGCGHGNYGERLQEVSGGRISSYTGIDAKRRLNWSELELKHSNFKFIESKSTDILPSIPPKTNLFITQSAIEHFDEDLEFFRQIKEFINRSGKPVMQIHLCPGKATLPLYFFHGIRQYTPRTLSKITSIFNENSEFELYPLGGKESAKVHFRYFTWPVLITRKFKKPTFDVPEYNEKLMDALAKDFVKPIKSPLFWALTVKTKPSRSN
jgi:hypothetical protein